VINKDIEIEDVHAVIGTGKDEKVEELARAIINRDAPSGTFCAARMH